MKEGVEKAHKFRKFCSTSSTFPVQDMWKYKNKVWPKKTSALPVAKRNRKGRLVSTPKELMKTLLLEYKDRLRPRCNRSDLKNHIKTMHLVSQLKLAKAWKNKSPPFTMIEFEKGIKDLNKGRARDPEGWCAEILQENVMGEDLKISLLELLNDIKTNGIVPDFMKESSVTTIPKPGSKFELANERGIFKLSVVRSLLIRLIYNRTYSILDYNMTDSNIGARKKKSCRNHIWIINNINYEHSQSVKLAQLVLQSWDFSQMFDSMCLDTTISDFYDHGADNDLLFLLNELNRNIVISVNTFYGSTEKVTIPKLVAQGDLMAPLMAAIQVDSISRRLQEEDRQREEEGRETLLYRYKGTVPVPSLGLLDDSAVITEVGFKSEIVNISMNECSAEKGLQFNEKSVNSSR